LAGIEAILLAVTNALTEVILLTTRGAVVKVAFCKTDSRRPNLARTARPKGRGTKPVGPVIDKEHRHKLQGDEIMTVKDSNGTTLSDGDSVTVIKDLKVKGSSVTLKRGTAIKNIRLTSNEEEVECNAEKVKGLVLKTCFLKKV
jgi:protein PhnA